jgi:hypothetical protein
MNYSIFEIKGGVGKNIMATAVAADIKKNYPDNELIIVSAYPAVWINNPNVYRVHTFDKLDYFFDNYIKDRESKIFVSEPYHDEGYIYKKCHLIQSWENQFNLEGDVSNSRPILLIQSSGGPENQNQKYSWYRDIPVDIAQEVANHYLNNNHRVLHIRRNDQLALENVETVTGDNFRDLFGVIALSDKRLFIDSFAQHAAIGLGLKSVVCWPVNNVVPLGYGVNHNIISQTNRKEQPNISGYLNEFDITGNLTQFDFEDNTPIFNTEEIINALETNGS